MSTSLDVPHQFPAFLTVDEYAFHTRRCRASVYNEITRGELRAVKIGRSTRIPVTELERLLAGSDAA